MIGLRAYLLLSAGLFTLGTYGLLTRRNAVGILLSVELMANAATLNLVAFSRHLAPAAGLGGQLFAIFAVALTVAEVAIGLALVILLHRTQKSIDASDASQLSG